MSRSTQNVLLVVSLVMGGLITYVDSRPTWDDTGVSAVAILTLSGIIGFLGPKRPWLWALAIGVWIPIYGIVRDGNYGTLLALAIAFLGSYVGMGLRTLVPPAGR